MKHTALRGVNLGGWLVLEKWITPSLFENTSAVDEYTFCKQAKEKERVRLKQFRDSFITEQDFDWLARHGIEAIRLPIGHWVFGSDRLYLPTVSYVDKAFRWAKKNGLKILIDLHTAPGSQNGHDHSGRQGTIGWHTDAHNIARTLAVIQKLAERYGRHPALLGISLLNEPSSRIPKTILLDYYHSAYDIIRRYCEDTIWIVYSDSYAPAHWRKELPSKTFKNVYLDRHHYQVFSPLDTALSARLNLLRARWHLPLTLARFQRYHPVIIGEWSLALGTPRLREQSASRQKSIAKAYGRLQLRAYKSTAAWFFWTYKTEDGGAWSFRDCVEQGLLPKTFEQ